MNQDKKTYLALTTGPIVATLQHARSTRAIWSASYLFSYFMRNVIAEFRNTHSFLLPYTGDEVFAEAYSCGLFHDRFIFEQKYEDDFVQLQANILAQLKVLSQKIARDIDADNLLEVETYILQHFRNCVLKIELENSENPIEKIDSILDTLELQPVYNQVERSNFLKRFIELKTSKSERSFLIDYAFHELIKQNRSDEIRFESILEITSGEFSREIFGDRIIYWNIFKDDINKTDKDRLIELVKEFNKGKKEEHHKNLMRYHKYYAVIHADGDNLGTLIKKLFENASIQSVADRFTILSKALFEFDKAVIRKIEGYDAMPIYVGGDDILCIAPVKNGERHIFNLVQDLDKVFKEHVVDVIDSHESVSSISSQLSMSYGISLSYYKHPMGEVVHDALNQLRNVAKRTPNKNAVSFRLLKHSGSHFGACFNKSSELYTGFFQKLLQFRGAGSADRVGNFLSSLQYQLYSNHGALESILHDDAALDHYFKNNFNESVHENSTFIDTVRDTIKQAWKDQENDTHLNPEERQRKTLQTVHAILRFVQFINQPIQDE